MLAVRVGFWCHNLSNCKNELQHLLPLCVVPRNLDLLPVPRKYFHSGETVCAWNRYKTPQSWLNHNKTIFPPQAPDEELRPAYVCHMKANVKYSPLKMWYIASFVRGMAVDEAVKQLSFLNKKGAVIAKEAILEAQQLAVEKHNVEFKTKLWVAESLAVKGQTIKGMRRHARGRVGLVHYYHCHYFVRLEEGDPPEHYYYHKRPLSGQELLDKWLTKMRNRKISSSL